MKRKILLSLIFFISILLLTTLAFGFFGSDDEYAHYSGLGNRVQITPDDQHFLFSYFINGTEAVYTANLDGTEIKQITKPNVGQRHHQPIISADLKHLLFLSRNKEGTDRLYISDIDGSNSRPITSEELHIEEAIFNNDGHSVYFIAIPAEEYLKFEEKKRGFDIYLLNIEETEPTMLTHNDYFSIDSLNLSASGEYLYFNKDSVYQALAVSKQFLSKPHFANSLPKVGYSFELSKNESKILYTNIAKESENTSLFKYDLFEVDLINGHEKRLTNLKSYVESPTYYFKDNKIAFLLYRNWPSKPEKYQINTLDLSNDKLDSIELSIPGEKNWHKIINVLKSFVNGTTLIVLYSLLIALVSLHLTIHNPKRRFLPVKISFGLSGIVLILSFTAAFIYDVWIGISLGIVFMALLGISVFNLLISLILQLISRKKNS